jgi:replicative DNA helicase
MPTNLALPHSIDAENAVLGSIIINPECLPMVKGIIDQPDEFYIQRNQWIFAAVCSIEDRHLAIDILTVADELERTNKLSQAGGPSYITQLVANTPTSNNAESYAKIVHSHSVRRRMIDAASVIARNSYDETQVIEDSVANSVEALHSVVNRLIRGRGQTIAESLDDVDKRLVELAKGMGVSLKTGFVDLDRLLGGMEPGQLILIAGRPGKGKTALMLNIAKNLAKHDDRPVAFFSLEMSNEELTFRLVASETEIDSRLLKEGRLTEQQAIIFTDKKEQMANLPIILDDTKPLTMSTLRAKTVNLRARGMLDLVILDYIQLMEGTGENRVQQVSYISRTLKMLAGELEVPIIAGCQLNRALEQRKEKQPILSDLRESGSLEQDADVVIFLHNPDDFNPKIPTEVIIAKQRNGPLGTLELRFVKEYVLFQNLFTDKFKANGE